MDCGLCPWRGTLRNKVSGGEEKGSKDGAPRGASRDGWKQDEGENLERVTGEAGGDRASKAKGEG